MAKEQAQQGGAEAPAKKKKAFKKRGEKRIVHHGFVHVQASFNNTLITITDADGAVVSWSSAGAIGFKGSRKGTPFAATQAARARPTPPRRSARRSCDVLVKGPGSGRESAIPRCRPPAWKVHRFATSRRSRTTAAVPEA